MPSDFSSRVTGGKELQANIAKLRKIAPQFTKDAVNTQAVNVHAQYRRNITDAPSVDTGAYRASAKIETFSNGFAKRVGSDSSYARPVEFGSAPHFPPLDPIREWARRHGIPESAAYAIALNISRRGTPAKPALFPAFEQERSGFEKLIREAWQTISRQMA
jgi:soluble lytic murein transglycosylase-like protein